MDSIFGRKRLAHKSRQPSLTGFDLNERSVPYDKLGPAPRSPVPVGTVSQGLRSGPTTSVISAPITNPTLTSNGTEFNIYQKNKADPQRAFALANEANNAARPGSPTASVSTADSSTLYNDSSFATITGTAKTPNKLRRSEASSSSGRRSPSMTDFGQFPYSGSSAGYPLNSPASAGMRPLSSANTTRTEASNRGSRYPPSLTSADSQSHFSHLSQHFYHRHGSQDDFNFPRPDKDDDIEALFENVKRTRDLGDMPHLSMEQKWHMVYNDEHIRWKEEKSREDQTKRQTETGQPAAIVEGTPEWYIKKFLDKTVTSKQAGSLLVSLRSKELRCAFGHGCHLVSLRSGVCSWFRHFVSIQGTSVLAQTLTHISRKGNSRYIYARRF
jgi:cytokinesis protein